MWAALCTQSLSGKLFTPYSENLGDPLTFSISYIQRIDRDMNRLNIRLVSAQEDFPSLADLLNNVGSHPITTEILHQWESRGPEGQIRRRYVAEAPEKGIVGYGLLFHDDSAEEGRFFIDVIVDPAWRRQGIGARLFDHVLSFSLALGATFFDCELRENCPECLRFAEKRDFIIDRHMFEYVLDLQEFDFDHYAPLITSLQNEGINFFSLADGGDTADLRRKLYEVNRQCSLDSPASKGTFPSYSEFSRQNFQASWFRARGQIMAADAEKIIGLSSLGYFEQNNTMVNMITGVLPEYRGRKIAQALKALALRYAQAYGAETVRAHNDSQNEAMLAINSKFGYCPRPGDYRLIRRHRYLWHKPHSPYQPQTKNGRSPVDEQPFYAKKPDSSV